MTTRKISDLVKAITAEEQKLEKNEVGSKEALLEKARSLVAELESPLEVIYGCILAEPSRKFSMRMALDFKIFDTLAAGNGRPKSTAELAAPMKASHKLVGRVLRHLCAMKMMIQTGEEEYAQNKITEYLAHAKYREGICYTFDAVGPTLSKMPEYLETTKYANPQDTNDGPFQYAHKTPNHWVWLEEHPRVLQAFQDYCAGVREDRPNFMDEGLYPVDDRLIKGLKTDGDAAAFIDVGGGTGHALAEFKAKVPEWKGRLVLQDQDSVVQIAKTESHASLIEPVVHDFFTAQPMMGARAYYMRHILHDWPDEECRTILRHLKNAMEPGYSKVLIHECVIADRDASWQHTGLDIYMMALFSAQERTEREWRELLESVGLKVTGIYSKGVGNLSLIEAMV
ncbi:MAG: hypothetical protein Q9160_004736 [Pyrenula sp. 1 TL-2023]